MCNHTQMNGPIVSEIYYPRPRYTWCAHQMMELKEVPAYAYQDFWSRKPLWQRWFFKLASYIIAPLCCCIFNNAATIPVYHDTRLLTTLRRGLQALDEGSDIVIFPEHDAPYNHILCDFQDKFIDVAKLYYKKTGKELCFVPMYLAPALRTFSPQGLFFPPSDTSLFLPVLVKLKQNYCRRVKKRHAHELDTYMWADVLRHSCHHAHRPCAKKDYNSLFTFGSAALVGFVMELLAVAVTDIYYYNTDFLLNLGFEPKQFPVFGGFMWGSLTVYCIKLAQKLRLGRWGSALAAGMFIVTMDILLDVVAIRLDGGFWTAMYGYCLAALCALGIHSAAPWFLVVGILFTAATLYVTVAEE